jgi:hypothetical protein
VGTGELAFEMPTVGGELESAVLVNTSPLVLTLPKGAPTPKITVCSPHRFLYAPTQKGTAVATACIVYKAQSCESVMIVSETVALKKINKGFWRRLADIFKKD